MCENILRNSIYIVCHYYNNLTRWILSFAQLLGLHSGGQKINQEKLFDQGCQIWTWNWVKLAPSRTNLGLLRPFFSTSRKEQKTDFKSARFVPSGANLALFESKPDIRALLCWPGVQMEANGLLKHGSKIFVSYVQATVPQISLVMRKVTRAQGW